MQTLRPTSDIDIGSWVDQSGGTTNLYSKMDDFPSVNDGDYAKENSGGSAVSLRVMLDPGSDPGVDTSHTIMVRARQSGVGETMLVTLVEGMTTRASFSVVPTSSFGNFFYTLTSPQAAAITSYASLELRFGGLGIQVSNAYMEVPDAGVADHLDASGAGAVVAAAGSGSYLEQSGAGLVKQSGTEGATALLVSGAGMVVSG